MSRHRRPPPADEITVSAAKHTLAWLPKLTVTAKAEAGERAAKFLQHHMDELAAHWRACDRCTAALVNAMTGGTVEQASAMMCDIGRGMPDQ